MRSGSWKSSLATAGVLLLTAATAVACSSTTSSSSTTSGGGGSGSSKIPSSAFSDHTGITSNSVHVGNVSTLAVGGLFKGALVGTQAYADYLNSTGGVNGRKITVDSGDDGFSGAGNKQATQNAISNDFYLVGGFSLQDNFGGTLLAKDPSVTAVLAGNDELAIGVMRAFADAGRSVPGEVSVVGFDDEPFAAMWSPALTTVAQDFPGLGRRAFGLLDSLLRTGSSPRTSTATPRLVLRESAGPAPASRR